MGWSEKWEETGIKQTNAKFKWVVSALKDFMGESNKGRESLV